MESGEGRKEGRGGTSAGHEFGLRREMGMGMRHDDD